MLRLLEDVWSLLLSLVSSSLAALPLDEAAKVSLLVVGAVSLVVVWCALGSPLEGHFSVLTLLLAATVLFLVLAPNLALFYLAWEIVAIVCWGIGRLVNRGSDPVLGVLPLQGIGGLASLAMFTGLLWYAVEGRTFDFAPASPEHLPFIVGLILFALFAKSLGVITQSWHEAAPRAGALASGLLGTVGLLGLGIYPLIRLLRGPLGGDGRSAVLVAGGPPLVEVLLLGGLALAVVVALAALGERDIYRVASYATLVQLGLFATALAQRAPAAVMAAFWGYIAYCAAILALYLSLGNVERASGRRRLGEVSGLARSLPVTAIGCLLAVLGLIGLPPFAGFGALVGLGGALLAGAPAAAIWLLGAALLLQFVALLRLVAGIFAGAGGPSGLREGAWNVLLALLVLGFGSLAVGLDASRLAELLRPVVGQLAS